ncbi:MAG: NAD-dependent deacylase [Chloroflexota bacterium]
MIPDNLIAILRQSPRVTVLTGAGISAESGVPTFRDAQTGLWANYRPEELATPEAFQRNPKLVWDWYLWRRQLVEQAKPNLGHIALKKMVTLFPYFALITQNVDGLHQQAGSEDVIELHGNIRRTKCFAAAHIVADVLDPHLAHCPICESQIRPDVVWFGEMLPREPLVQAFHVSQECDVFLSIGTSALVQPAASLPLEAVQEGAILVEVNLAPTPLSQTADFVLQGPAGTILPDLVAQLT